MLTSSLPCPGVSLNHSLKGCKLNNVVFKNRATADIYDGVDSRAARNLLPLHLHAKAAFLIDRLYAAQSIRDLLSSPGLRIEKLKGNRTGEYSLRINEQYRICFRIHDGDAIDVEITDYH